MEPIMLDVELKLP